MRILVTGSDGFVGRHLVPVLVQKGFTVYAASRKSEGVNNEVINVTLDLLDEQQIHRIIKEIKPDGIIHLAAQSLVKRAWENPEHTFSVNTTGTFYMIRALKDFVPHARFINIGSSEEYGLTGKKGEALKEDDPCFPQNPYASSKLSAGQVAIQLARKDNLNLIHIRPFNHFGPGQRVEFVVSDFCSQIARIENSLLPPIIQVGDLSAQRDFTDVRDVVNAYLLLLQKNVESGIYNVCSGTPRAIQDVLDFLLTQAKLKIDVKIDQGRFRPSEVPMFYGTDRKIHKVTGWYVQRNFEESLLETLDWWRLQVKSTH
jgi:GDP-4-dehydro-6-deoxy-D-mannose reductase